MIAPAGCQTLVLAWGNPGRLDDGLGPEFAARAAAWTVPGLHVLSTYQLQVEHALEVAQAKTTVFVDASREGPAPFDLQASVPAPNPLRYTSHQVSPAGLLSWSQELYAKTPDAWILGIRGYRFDDFGEVLSPRAEDNLKRAIHYLESSLRDDPELRIWRERHGTRQHVAPLRG